MTWRAKARLRTARARHMIVSCSPTWCTNQHHALLHTLIVVHYTCMWGNIKLPIFYYQIQVGFKLLQFNKPHNPLQTSLFNPIYILITLRKYFRSNYESLSHHNKEQLPTISFRKLHEEHINNMSQTFYFRTIIPMRTFLRRRNITRHAGYPQEVAYWLWLWGFDPIEQHTFLGDHFDSA